jgi:hypothetical protein
LLKSLAARGIQGDARAANLILTLISRLLEPDDQPVIAGEVSAEDEAILKAYLARIEATKEPSK